jgi:tetratricopeptide (TPR) repeat protein
MILTVSVSSGAADCNRGRLLVVLAHQQLADSDKEHALESLEQSIDACPTYDAYEEYAELASHAVTRAVRQRAASAFTKAESLAPSSEARWHTLYAYAQYLYQEDDPGYARRVLDVARSVKPGDPIAEKLIARVDQELNPIEVDLVRGGLPSAKPLEDTGDRFRTALAEMPPFPWPPPSPSEKSVIPADALFGQANRAAVEQTGEVRAMPPSVHLRDIDAVLRAALQKARYEFSYYAAPRGFALVARLERFTEKGAPYPGAQRFDGTFRPFEQFTIRDYLRALLLAPPGYYRVIVFIVSPQPFTSTSKPVTSEEARDWLDNGVNSLPRTIGALPYVLPDYTCTALIYEFEKRDMRPNPFVQHPGRLTVEAHLEGSGISLTR